MPVREIHAHIFCEVAGVSLRDDIHADVAIVGAGITGLTAALLLAEKGRRVIVVEKETIASSETGNITAHLTVALDARYHYVQRRYGREEAKLLAAASRASLEKIAEIVRRYSIDCHFRRVPGYLYTEKRRHVAELKNEAAAAREAGLEAQYVTDVPLPFETRGAVLFPDQAQFHPRQYMAGLARHAAAAGAQIFEHTFATHVDQGVVETEHGRITADAVFLATNVPMQGSTLMRTYAIAFQVDGAHPDGLFRDTSDPYHSTCWQETEAGTFMIVGGENHRAGGEKDPEGCFARLASYAREHFGAHPEMYRWSGEIIEPQPLIGGTLGAMIVSDLILGVKNPWADVFQKSRGRCVTALRLECPSLQPERWVSG